MIIQPDFPDHWKTRLLVELTGRESAPMAVIRLWAHCQNSKRSIFPEMTPSVLASICRWGDLKPSCHAALVRSGFVVKLDPKGFAVHQWSDHNAQLLQKWRAGEKGGRPPASTNANEISPSEKPTGNRPTTDRKPDGKPGRTDHSNRSNRSDLSKRLDRLDRSDLKRLPNRLNVKRLSNRSKEEVETEEEFMALCLEVLGKQEMMNGGPKGEGHGGLWRTLFRQNADKAWRVLREVRATLKERPAEIRTTPARFAMDLWKRFK